MSVHRSRLRRLERALKVDGPVLFVRVDEGSPRKPGVFHFVLSPAVQHTRIPEWEAEDDRI